MKFKLCTRLFVNLADYVKFVNKISLFFPAIFGPDTVAWQIL